MNTKLIQAMMNIGMDTLPDNEHESLALYGFDSLKMALLVMELERVYEMRIDLNQFSEERFVNLHSINSWIADLKEAEACVS